MAAEMAFAQIMSSLKFNKGDDIVLITTNNTFIGKFVRALTMNSGVAITAELTDQNNRKITMMIEFLVDQIVGVGRPNSGPGATKFETVADSQIDEDLKKKSAKKI